MVGENKMNLIEKKFKVAEKAYGEYIHMMRNSNFNNVEGLK